MSDSSATYRLAGAEDLLQAHEQAATEYPETADIETSSDDYASRFAGPVGEWFLTVQAEATLKMLAPYPAAKILDVGGGHGQLTGPLIDQGYDVTVLASAPQCAQRIERYIAADQCQFDVGNVLELPYEDGAFDVVISYRLLPHVTRWQELLAEFCRVARTAVIVDFPEVRSFNYIAPQLFKFKKKLEGNTRAYLSFRRTDLVQFYGEHGFAYDEHFAEFFLPMVLHRALKKPAVSAAAEDVCRAMRLTNSFGSPVILKMVRSEETS